MRAAAPADVKIVWIAQYYQTSNIERQAELDECIKANSTASFVHRTILLCEGSAPSYILPSNVELVMVDKRISFGDVFDHVDMCGLDSEWIVVFSNTDIFLDKSLVPVCMNLRLKDVVCLTRHEFGIGLSMTNLPETTQDTWIFSAIICRTPPKKTRQISLGILGCDVAFAAVMESNGYNIWNPCINTYTYHNHASNERSYDHSQRIDRPYAFPRECTQEQFFLRIPRRLVVDR